MLVCNLYTSTHIIPCTFIIRGVSQGWSQLCLPVVCKLGVTKLEELNDDEEEFHAHATVFALPVYNAP